MQLPLSPTRAATGTAIALLSLAGSASAATLRGVTVQDNARAHTFVIADAHGRLSEIHARRAPRVGTRVVISARRLRNGTYALRRLEARGSARRARMRGTVTYVNRSRREFVVSARGVSLLVHRGAPVASRRLAPRLVGPAPALPAVGSVVALDASVSGGDISTQTVADQGTASTGVDLEGTVLSVDAAAGTISISADDAEQSSAALTVIVPPTLSIQQFQQGERVELIASLNPDGTYTLEQSSGDGSITQAQSQGDQQGNGEGDQQSSASVQCLAQQSDPGFPAAHNGETFTQYYSVGSSDPADAFGRCVDAAAGSTAGQPSAEQQCLAQQGDPGFPATHNGETFVQYYSTDPTQLNPEDSFGHCIDLLQQSSDGSQSGGDGSQSGGDGSQPSGSQGDGSQPSGSQSGGSQSSGSQSSGSQSGGSQSSGSQSSGSQSGGSQSGGSDN